MHDAYKNGVTDLNTLKPKTQQTSLSSSPTPELQQQTILTPSPLKQPLAKTKKLTEAEKAAKKKAKQEAKEEMEYILERSAIEKRKRDRAAGII